ncbi:MAG: M48 family metallopeptidase [Pikeienuella sp.]
MAGIWQRVLRNKARARPALPETIRLDTPKIEVRLRPHPRARRLTLRLGADGRAVLTLPPGVAEPEAQRFLARHAAWLAQAHERQPAPLAVAWGMGLPVDGRLVTLEPGSGSPRLDADRLVLRADGEPGPQAAAWLKRRASARLVPLAEGFAAQLGREVTGFAFRDTRSRWGSCTAQARLNFSWRIAMAPAEVQTYLAAHEAAHLVEMNHSPQYWAVLEGLMPTYRRPRDWLKSHGRSLHRYRFS